MTALRTIQTVGFVGLGAMGSGIAQRRMDAGHDVVGWSRTRTRADALTTDGMGSSALRAAATWPTETSWSMWPTCTDEQQE